MRAAFDRAIGRAPLHLLTIGWLCVLVVVAFVLSAVGELFYTPLQLLLSVLVLVVSAVVVNSIVAAVLRTAAHHRSAVITALILFFVFWPVSDIGGLAILALTAAIAILSKYVLAIRGRHLLNPAAIAAVVITLVGLNASTWWVATPLFLPFVIVGAFFVLYRTRRVLIGVVFVVVSVVIAGVPLVAGGTDVGAALAVIFTSYPVIFFAGFLLSEPLTLPPRRWQQLSEAAVVALLFAIPFRLGPVFSSPEIALVLGNIVAFVFIGTAGLRLVYTGKRQVSDGVYEFAFTAHRPLPIRPGQYLDLSIPHRADARGSRRPFSVITAPGENGRATAVSFGVRVDENGSSFKRALMDLPHGAKVRGTWAGGDFLPPTGSGTAELLVAGGVGITPFVGELREWASVGSAPRDVIVLYSVPSQTDAPFLDELGASGVPVYLAVTVADVCGGKLPANVTLLPPGRVSVTTLALLPDVGSRQARVSGPPAFVDSMRSVLRGAGVRKVRADYFSGY